MKKIAAILPRYAIDIGGGAETLVGTLMQKLAEQGVHEFGAVEVEIWATCARDHRTWENHFPEGSSIESGIKVRRFAVDERNLDTFISAELAIADGRRLSVEQQLNWLENSVNSRSLYLHIAKHAAEFDSLLFAPYLFATSFWGALIAPEKSILIPCLHNETYAYQEIFSALFTKVSRLIFNAEAEMRLASELYGAELLAKSSVVGMGFDEPKQTTKTISNLPNEYILYLGRKERGKNLDLLCSYVEYYNQQHRDNPITLVVAGAGEIDFLVEKPLWLLDMGFVTAEEKRSLLQNAICLCQPSKNESFSIVIMESWLEKTPVIVHGACDVTKEHVVKSNGGLYFSNKNEFVSVINEFRMHQELRNNSGSAGFNYVISEYSWAAVMKRLELALKEHWQGKEEANASLGKSATC